MLKKVLATLLIATAFFLGSWSGTARTSNKPATAFASTVVQGGGGDFEKECDNTTWFFYCAGAPACNCINIQSAGTGCGDNASGNCCKTCFRSN